MRVCYYGRSIGVGDTDVNVIQRAAAIVAVNQDDIVIKGVWEQRIEVRMTHDLEQIVNSIK